ncbi:uncharacterized protein LOC115961390 [Quercus lobata]|uniref:uncharacterized protein LOC115961390 n=1 Tax=Quercus lobata TaxID=97700 RepID=UPI001246A949|nr:uncharacterized protein LOC115961390 [Quercus lobata]
MMQGAATVTGFFTDLQAAWDQLLNFRPLPCCSCGKCTYGVDDKIATFQHQDSLMQFLNGLNDSYSQVRTQILMMEPRISIDKATSLMIQEERQRCLGFTAAPSVESTTLAVKNQGNSFPGNNSKNFKGNNVKEKPACSHCAKLGHVMEKCYKLVGFPPSYKQKGRYRQLISMLNPHASTSGGTNDALHSTNSALSVFAINLVNKTAYGNDVWILDTRATDHTVHSLSLFTHITSSISTFVQLPNGEKVTVTHIDSVSTLSVTKPYLWHMRFGHVSDNKLHALHNNAFDLIHCDVWGPFAKFTHDGFRILLYLGLDGFPSGTAAAEPSGTAADADVAVPPLTAMDDSDIRRTLDHLLTIQAAQGQILVDVLDEIRALRAKLE